MEHFKLCGEMFIMSQAWERKKSSVLNIIILKLQLSRSVHLAKVRICGVKDHKRTRYVFKLKAVLSV